MGLAMADRHRGRPQPPCPPKLGAPKDGQEHQEEMRPATTALTEAAVSARAPQDQQLDRDALAGVPGTGNKTGRERGWEEALNQGRAWKCLEQRLHSEACRGRQPRSSGEENQG